MDEPLIWTMKGNLPVNSLTYATRWERTEEYVKLIETYSLGDEVVRESAHVLLTRGLTADAVAQPLN